MTMTQNSAYTFAARTDEVLEKTGLVVHVAGHTVALFAHQGRIFAVDNRCPHMGFPLHRGTVNDCILTCHWHHARFDLETGGTFDPWADDLRAYPVEVRGEEVWVDVAPPGAILTQQRQRLRDGLERDLSLVLGKSVLRLLEAGDDPAEPFRIGLEFGVRQRRAGWGQGLTIHTCMMNLLPYLDAEDRPRALFHGLSAVARDSAGMPPRFAIQPLPTSTADLTLLKRWFRQFIEVRDADGAERCLVSAIRSGADSRQMADMLFAAATDHRYLQIGHVLDFTNKALEALDIAGWEYAEGVLPSLASAYAGASRMEESNSWRSPIDLVALLEDAFEKLPAAQEAGEAQQGTWNGREALTPLLLGEEPQASVQGLLNALKAGATAEELAGAVAYAAALRIAQFNTTNEFGDWDTALHTFTFANAVHQGLRRSPSTELLRGVFDAAISVYLDRFLNVPAAKLPATSSTVEDPEALLPRLFDLLDRQQQVSEAARLVAAYLQNGDPDRLLAMIGKLLLREDRDFHTIQTVEAAFRQYATLRGTPAGDHILIAAVRYLAAHAPTMRAQGQTYQIARRLCRGEHLYEEDPTA